MEHYTGHFAFNNFYPFEVLTVFTDEIILSGNSNEKSCNFLMYQIIHGGKSVNKTCGGRITSDIFTLLLWGDQ